MTCVRVYMCMYVCINELSVQERLLQLADSSLRMRSGETAKPGHLLKTRARTAYRRERVSLYIYIYI